MAIEAVSSGGFDEVHADFLSKSRQACYKALDAFMLVWRRNPIKNLLKLL
uniref:Uncharacterized protein n=1 Tax=Cucumis melo TaxID=3656 RepID=A0A9I9E7H6_CUCME